MEMLAANSGIILFLVLGFGIFMAWGIGANDVVIASGTGLPISTTHTLVGAVLGVGLARGTAVVDFEVVKRIVGSWLVTLPIAAVLSISFYFLLNALLG